ncbi:hypothetical protein Tco_0893714 [Tanacetum coccineum]|uniref:Uncharacterized protein n=1 Tax=Tanacetum coccineum TaxID=301880 RepID=A0ABQ5CCI5_9ASTR
MNYEVAPQVVFRCVVVILRCATLWIYWIRGDDEVELTDEESSDDMDEVFEVFRIDTNLFDFETSMCKAFE